MLINTDNGTPMAQVGAENLVFSWPLCFLYFVHVLTLSKTIGGVHFFGIAFKEFEGRLQNFPGVDADIIHAASSVEFNGLCKMTEYFPNFSSGGKCWPFA